MDPRFGRTIWVALATLTLSHVPSPGQVVFRAMGGPMAATPGNVKGDMHIPPGKNVSFDVALTDGGGYLWNIGYNGNVNSGTNNAYSSGMYCCLNGSTMQSNGQAWMNVSGDEIEMGPCMNNAGVAAYRRIKVFKDAPCARWLEILENPSGQPITLNARINTNFCWNIGRTVSSSGQASAGGKDWALVTEMQNAGNNVPALLHVFGDKRSKVRPRITAQGCNMAMDYSLTIPAGRTVVLCHFESQNNSADALVKGMAAWRTYKLLRDLPPSVRKLIVNFSGSTDGLSIQLDRQESADKVVLAAGDPVLGTIENETFALQTQFGDVNLPAAGVVGMVAGGEDDAVRFVLADGQVVVGRPGAEAPLQVSLPTGGKLEIPFGRIKTWAYRISKERPEEIRPAGAVAGLRTGDQLAFDPAQTPLSLRTADGVVPLSAADVVEIAMDNPGNGMHRVRFVNGSRLAGLIEPDRLTLALRLGPKLQIPRDAVVRIGMGNEEKPDESLAHLVLGNEDELNGSLVETTLSVETQYGTVQVKPDNVREATLAGAPDSLAALTLWDGTVLRGRLREDDLTLRLTPGPTVKIPTCRIVTYSRAQSLPPDHIVKRVEELIGRLNAESYKDRQAASDELARMGAPIAPLLAKHLAATDPEVRQRIEEIIENATGKRPEAPK